MLCCTHSATFRTLFWVRRQNKSMVKHTTGMLITKTDICYILSAYRVIAWYFARLVVAQAYLMGTHAGLSPTSACWHSIKMQQKCYYSTSVFSVVQLPLLTDAFNLLLGKYMVNLYDLGNNFLGTYILDIQFGESWYCLKVYLTRGKVWYFHVG